MKIIVAFTFTFVTFLSFAQDKNTYKHIGDSLIRIEQYDTAIKYFYNELKKHPNNDDILRWLGHIQKAQNKFELAEKYYYQALNVNYKCAICYIYIGELYYLQDYKSKALEYFNLAVKTDPEDASLYSFRARLKDDLGDKFGALYDHNQAIKIDPQNARYYLYRGIQNANSSYYALAISDFTKAIELSPEEYYPYFQRASSFFSQNMYDEALEDINTAIKLDSSQVSLYTGRGAIYSSLNNRQKAINDYSKAISLDENEFLPYLNRAKAYYALENLDSSCIDYHTLSLLIKKGEIPDSTIVKEIKDGINGFCDPTKASFYYQRGIALYNLNEFQNAINMYNIGLKKFPSSSMTFSFKGNAFMELSDYKNAIEQYNLSLEYKSNLLEEIKQSPQFWDASNDQIIQFYNGSLASTYLALSECKFNLQRYIDAIEDLNKAIELAPNLPGFNDEIYYNMRGHIRLMTKEYNLAILDFNKSIERNGTFDLAYVNRAITKVSLSEKVNITYYTIKSKINSEPIRIDWNFRHKSSLKKSKPNLLSALADCNTAIEINPDFGFAYYIRGQIKQLLLHNDYCLDFSTAQNLGITVEKELLLHCIE